MPHIAPNFTPNVKINWGQGVKRKDHDWGGSARVRGWFEKGNEIQKDEVYIFNFTFYDALVQSLGIDVVAIRIFDLTSYSYVEF